METETSFFRNALVEQVTAKEMESRASHSFSKATLETTQGQIDGLLSQLPFKCYLPEVASVGD